MVVLNQGISSKGTGCGFLLKIFSSLIFYTISEMDTKLGEKQVYQDSPSGCEGLAQVLCKQVNGKHFPLWFYKNPCDAFLLTRCFW